MAAWYVEHRPLASLSPAVDVARHLQTRSAAGPVVIVAAHPLGFLASLRKQWLKLSRAVQREQVSTLDPARRAALADELTRMNCLRFRAADTADEADVLIVEPTAWAATPTSCATVYLCSRVTPAALDAMLAQVPPHILVVDYAEHRQLLAD